jgi:hypothetical protein
VDPDRQLTAGEMEQRRKLDREKTDGDLRDEYYRNQPMDSDPRTIRAHMWMME